MFPIKDQPSSGIFPIITIIIIFVTTIVFGIELLSPNTENLIYQFALVPSSVNFLKFSTLTPFLTSIFLHGGFMHIIFNMWFLWIYGDNVEAALGKIRFILFYLSGGIIAGIIQYFFLIGDSVPILGASGAIAAVLGFYFVKFPRNTVKTIIPLFLVITTVNLPSRIVLFSWFLTQILSGTSSLAIQTQANSGIAWWAHIGGFIYGIIIGIIFKQSIKTAATGNE